MQFNNDKQYVSVVILELKYGYSNGVIKLIVGTVDNEQVTLLPTLNFCHTKTIKPS